MKWCRSCKLNVNTERKICPLCFNSLEDKDNVLDEFKSYPKRTNIKEKKHILYKLLIFISIISIGVSLLVNYMTIEKNPHWWSLYVVVSVVYLYTLARFTISPKTNAIKKLLFQGVFISLLVYAIDYLSSGGVWALQIVIPSILIATNTASVIIFIINRKNFGESVVPGLILILLGIIPFILQVCNIIEGDSLWAPISSCGYSIVIIIGLIVFSGKEIIEELRKRFHV